MKLTSYHNLRVPNFSVHALTEVLRNADLDWRGALAKADIAIDAINRPGATIPAQKELAFQLRFVDLTSDRVDLWVAAARAYTLSSIGDRGMATLTSPTLAAWVALACTTDVGYSVHEIAPLRTPDDELAGVELSYPTTPPALVPWGAYRDTVWILRTLQWLYGEPLPFTRVDFPLATIAAEIQPLLPADVRTGAETLRIWWAPEASHRPLPFGNTFQHESWIAAESRVIDALQTTGDWPATVAKAIRDAPQFNRNMANVAAAMHTSPRTLQRNLQLCGKSFAEIRDATLCELASELLSTTDHPVGRISDSLGYAELASFTIAFKRWTGVPPTVFRASARYASAERGASPAGVLGRRPRTTLAPDGDR